jgi:hypothetical protein
MVTPFRTNSALYALYQILQDGTEVGRVYARGTSPAGSTEVWQFYTDRVTGDGRGAYTWPSYQEADHEKQVVSLVFVFVREVELVDKPDPDFTEGREYQQITAAHTSP